MLIIKQTTRHQSLSNIPGLSRTSCVGFFIVLSPLLAACATSTSLPVAGEMQDQCFLNETLEPVTKTCRVLSQSDWQALGLAADDPVSSKLLALLDAKVESEQASRNFYASFVQEADRDLPVVIRDAEGWTLEAILESAADKTVCSHSQPVEALLKESVGGNSGQGEDKKQGNRCGNISIIHSLVRLGVLSPDEAFRGDYLNPDVVTVLDEFHADDPGMTPDQQRQGYHHFNTPQRRINCQATLSGDITNKDSVLRVARALKTTMESEESVYDCSLAVHGDKQADGSYGLKHVEHVTGVRVENDEYLIDTLDGFHQGESAQTIPKTPAKNTWGVGSGLGGDWVQLKRSTLKSNVRQFSEIPPQWIEMRCCVVVENQ